MTTAVREAHEELEPGERGMTTAVREAHEEVRERVSVAL